jgi:hypothetical protein
MRSSMKRVGGKKGTAYPLSAICRNSPKAGTMLAWPSHEWCLSPFFPLQAHCGPHVITAGERRRLERRWLLEKLVVGTA